MAVSKGHSILMIQLSCGCFVSDLVSALAVRIVPRLAARADTDCYGQIQGPIQKHPDDNT